MQFDSFALRLVIDNLAAGSAKYEIGPPPSIGKVADLERAVPSKIKRLDCSGYVQYVIYKSTYHHVRIPQGTMRQQEWLSAHGYTEHRGHDAYAIEAAKLDGCVRVGYRKKVIGKKARGGDEGGSEKDGVGHVWLVINGRTYECTTKKGRNGPTSFDWSVRTADADSLFFLGAAPMFAALAMP